jgi:hypothetical protein
VILPRVSQRAAAQARIQADVFSGRPIQVEVKPRDDRHKIADRAGLQQCTHTGHLRVVPIHEGFGVVRAAAGTGRVNAFELGGVQRDWFFAENMLAGPR